MDKEFHSHNCVETSKNFSPQAKNGTLGRSLVFRFRYAHQRRCYSVKCYVRLVPHSVTVHFTRISGVNFIYYITCTLCKKIYIGETEKISRTTTRHSQKKKTGASKPVARHFNLPNHSHYNMTICKLSLHHANIESLQRPKSLLDKLHDWKVEVNSTFGNLSRNNSSFGRCRICYTVKCFVQLVLAQCRQNILMQVRTYMRIWSQHQETQILFTYKIKSVRISLFL